MTAWLEIVSQDILYLLHHCNRTLNEATRMSRDTSTIAWSYMLKELQDG